MNKDQLISILVRTTTYCLESHNIKGVYTFNAEFKMDELQTSGKVYDIVKYTAVQDGKEIYTGYTPTSKNSYKGNYENFTFTAGTK